MPSPRLKIRRLVVDGMLSTDLSFREDVSIIRADAPSNDVRATNKCGKTALVELIQHGLGRRHESLAKFHFAPIAHLLDKAWLEVEVNGRVLTLQRSLQQITARMQLFSGPYSSITSEEVGDMIAVEDISSVLLSLLDIPEVFVKLSDGSLTPLSFPNLMRSFILHQDDSFGAILDKVQPQQRRTDIVGFMTKITPIARFPLEEQLGAVQVELQDLQRQYEVIREFLASNGVPSILEAQRLVDSARARLDEARESQQRLLTAARGEVDQASSAEPGALDIMRSRLLDRKAALAAAEHQRSDLVAERDRLKQLVGSLRFDREKNRRLRTSSEILRACLRLHQAA